jgi:3-oxoacyl-[acyl-carrier protein] reductase
MKINFEGKTVLVTGATRGIGRQIADDFSALGARLILTGTDPKEIKRLNRRSSSVKMKYYCVDFTKPESTELFLKELRKINKIDVCINNAGINRVDYIDEVKTEDWDDILSVNLKAPFLVMREVARLMKKNHYGRIVNIASIFGVIGKEKRSVYSASKFGLRGLTVSSSNELARFNILVNAVSPGFVLTDLTRRILSSSQIRALASQVPMKRFACAKDISNVVIFLASDSNTYINGQNIVVDGGYVNA